MTGWRSCVYASISKYYSLPPMQTRTRKTLITISGVSLAIPATILAVLQISSWAVVKSDVRAHLLSFAIDFDDVLEVQLAFVNQGNRQGAVTNVSTATLMEFRGTVGYIQTWSKDSETTLTGVPAVLNPGDIRLVTLREKLLPSGLYPDAQPVDPEKDNVKDFPDLMKAGVRKAEFALGVQALDYKGRKYDGYWKLARLFLTDTAIPSYRLETSSPAYTVFNKTWKRDTFNPFGSFRPPKSEASSQPYTP
jgi:hypothetical protein